MLEIPLVSAPRCHADRISDHGPGSTSTPSDLDSHFEALLGGSSDVRDHSYLSHDRCYIIWYMLCVRPVLQLAEAAGKSSNLLYQLLIGHLVNRSAVLEFSHR